MEENNISNAEIKTDLRIVQLVDPVRRDLVFSRLVDQTVSDVRAQDVMIEVYA